MESGSLKKELLELFHYHYDTATTSAFSQQREKILPEALAFLFQEFNHAFTQNQSYREYRLLACDGTALNISRNSSDQENYFQSNPGEKGFSQLHLNALYDLGSRRYVDAVIQPGRKNNECRALTDMGIINSSVKATDYQGYNLSFYSNHSSCFFKKNKISKRA